MYAIIWEFQPRENSEKLFENVYGPLGLWAEFFRKGEGYLRTELFHDADNPRRYFTIDYWTSQTAYEAFRARHADEYATIDNLCEPLNQQETHIASLTTVSLSRSSIPSTK
jgi:heme-degrading monooxygenase HmoA